ncbi:predicted protein [Lichtheimia corymbifera JMRC:FSU:9682]|uniref:Uncharacterized protein n=1 Tax=Lichtheimia corymbifera JMRC:FSU:9682 TaxID=1263082 RepID=A0A068SBJ8_9FUNG|nr:predicted protein [Lichtheimia corymbifera JMRC:FSU:9682]
MTTQQLIFSFSHPVTWATRSSNPQTKDASHLSFPRISMSTPFWTHKSQGYDSEHEPIQYCMFSIVDTSMPIMMRKSNI